MVVYLTVAGYQDHHVRHVTRHLIPVMGMEYVLVVQHIVAHVYVGTPVHFALLEHVQRDYRGGKFPYQRI